MTVEWCERKINRLSELNDKEEENEEKKQIIDELFIKLGSLTSLELKNIACNADLGRLFNQLTSSDDSIYIEQVCKTLTILFGALEPGDVHKHYPREIHEYLSHSCPSVKIVILNELDRTANDPDKVGHLLNDINLLIQIIETIGDESLKVAMIAMDTIKKIGRVSEGAKIIYTDNMLRTFARLISKNDVITFRIYEVIIDIAKSSEEGFKATANSGFLNSLVQVLDADDVLIQLNALEAMTELAINEAGLNYLKERDVLKKLADQVERANENPLSNLVIPGLMKFFGNVARYRPDEIFTKYPIVISALFQVIDGDDFVLLANALDTLGIIASTVEGKYALESFGDSMERVMKRIGEIIEKLPTELRLRGLNNLGLIIHVDKSKQDNRILSLTKYWFDLLHNESLNFIVNLCKQPFADIKYASMKVVAEIASQTWGQEYIAVLPGFIEFLLDRGAESFSNCKEIKYEIIKNLCDASVDIFDSPTLQRLQTYIQQGPFYVDLGNQVATEALA